MLRVGLLLAVLLAGCGQDLSPAERAAEEERAIALVHKGNAAMPPLREVIPEPILYPDIERHNLSGAGCNYAPGTSLGTRVVARPADAFVKIDGAVQRLAADPGSRELQLGSRSLYIGREYELRLELAGEGAQSGTSTVDFEGTVSLRDQYGRVVYQGSGLAQCGS